MAQEKSTKTADSKKDASKSIAAVLIRGTINTSPDTRTTLEKLGLERKNSCVLLKNDESTLGMLKKVKDYITYGEIDAETIKQLKEKRGIKDSEGNFKSFFRLNPPIGGFERKGIKKSYTSGGALGNRGIAMKDLILKML